MAGTILENLSNRKLFCVLAIIFMLLFASFFVGALVAPAPSNTEQISATFCVPENSQQLSIPRHQLINRKFIPKNCQEYKMGEKTDKSVVFAFQIPGSRDGQILDYSRWMSYLISMLVPEINYRNYGRPSSDPRNLNASILLRITLAAKDVKDRDWKIITRKDQLKRTLNCKIASGKVEDGAAFDCDAFQLFELQSLYYDYYLINLEFVSHPDIHNAQLTGLLMVAIHQNGGFTKVLLITKTVFFFITLLTFIWYCKRLRQLGRKNTLLEKTIILLGLAITQLNAPLEYLSLYYDLGFMNFLSDVRQGILYCALLCFWRIFTGEHLLDGVQRSRLSLYYQDLIVILTASIILFIFDSADRGIQWLDPFFTIWEVDSFMAHIFIAAVIFATSTYFVSLCYNVWLVRKNIISKKTSLPGMSSTRRLVYEGIIYRFNFLLVATIFSAGATFVAYIMGQMGDSYDWEDESNYWQLQWSSATIFFVYAMWNCYILILMILYAPSHKGRGIHFDAMSEEIEFNRLTDNDDHLDTNGDTSSLVGKKKTRKTKAEATSMQLLQDLTSHRSVD